MTENDRPGRLRPRHPSLVAGVKATMWVDVPTLLWSTPIQIAGGNLAFTATGRVAALGGTLGYTFMAGHTPIATRVKVFREFDVENRLEGTSAFFTLAIPLSSGAAPPPTKPVITK